MKHALFFTLAALFTLAAPSVLAQTDAGTPPINPNTSGSLPSALKVTPPSQPGLLLIGKMRHLSGRPVPMTFRVLNQSNKIVTYNFGTGQRFDITVSNSAGVPVWNWSANKRFSQNLASVKLLPGKSLDYSVVWDGRDLGGRPVPPGAYTAEARLVSNNRPAITGGVVVNTDPDPNNMGSPTRTPADSGAIRQVDPAAQVTAKASLPIR